MTYLTIDQTSFDQHFPEQSFGIKHQLTESKLFALPRLIELSQTLPAEQVEYNAGNIAIDQDPSETPRTGLSVAETIERIETCQSWMVLKYIERDPEYKQLLDQCLNQVDGYASRCLSGLDTRAGFIFITSPNSITPFHFDPEHNFLLQIRGKKIMHTFDKTDRTVLPEENIEDKYINPHAHRNQTFKDELQAKAKTYELMPGDGLYVPINAPHWVQNGDNVSISFSITFLSKQAKRQARLYTLNGFLRQRIGLTPTPVGQSPRLDTLKHGSCLALRGAQRLFKRPAN